MPNRIGSTPSKALYATLAATLLATGAARAADDCLAAPNGDAPAGSHWYYHNDRARHQICWYLGAQSLRVRRAEPEAQAAGKSTALTSQEFELPMPPPRPVAAPPRANLPEDVEDIPPRRPPVPIFEMAQTEPTGGESGGSLHQNLGAHEAAAPTVAASRAGARTMLPLLIASAIAAAGVLQYAIFRLLVARRRPVRLERGRAGRIASLASQKRPPVRASARPRNVGHPPPVPTFFPDLDQETPSLEEGIRQLVQSMESVAA